MTQEKHVLGGSFLVYDLPEVAISSSFLMTSTKTPTLNALLKAIACTLDRKWEISSEEKSSNNKTE